MSSLWKIQERGNEKKKEKMRKKSIDARQKKMNSEKWRRSRTVENNKSRVYPFLSWNYHWCVPVLGRNSCRKSTFLQTWIESLDRLMNPIAYRILDSSLVSFSVLLLIEFLLEAWSFFGRGGERITRIEREDRWREERNLGRSQLHFTSSLEKREIEIREIFNQGNKIHKGNVKRE